MRSRVLVPVAAVAVLAAAGCHNEGETSAARSQPVVTTTTVTSPVSSSPSHAPARTRPKRPAPTRTTVPNGDVLLAGGAIVLPNRVRTPGATNPLVTQATIRQTICLTGYTKTIRPPSSYTTALKEQQLASGYAYRSDTDTSAYEEDHLVALEIGGSPRSIDNLWPEPDDAAEGAGVKDRVENELHDLVCSGRLPLATAQHAIATNWWNAYQEYGGEAVPTVWAGSYTAATGTSTTATSTTGTSTGTTTDNSGATAKCVDGTYSYSQHRSGTCSHHGGVAYWINRPAS